MLREWTNYAVQGIALLLMVAWLPVMWRFFRQWRHRRNPISMAICLLVAFACYVNFTLIVMRSGVNDELTHMSLLFVETVFCLTFYVSFRRAEKFVSTRQEDAPRS